VLIPSLNNIQQVSAGCDHSLVLNNNGNVYSFGNNDVKKSI
jgi:alpha-tubulin suppressor-like RCC1 family protein